jgi:hypothetical protein
MKQFETIEEFTFKNTLLVLVKENFYSTDGYYKKLTYRYKVFVATHMDFDTRKFQGYWLNGSDGNILENGSKAKIKKYAKSLIKGE